MAVEIPVVIDIEGAFQDAARRVPKAVEPLKKSLAGLSEDLAFWQEQLGKAAIGSADFKLIAKEIQNITQAMDVANKEFTHYATNDGSIKRLSNELAFLSDQWEKMAASEKFTASGGLSADAQKLLDRYREITAELQKSGKSLAQMEAEEKKILELAKRRADASTKAAQKRRYENSILNTSVKTIRVLTEQERILSEKIKGTAIGSDKYKNLAQSLQQVRKELAQARAQIEGAGSSMNKMGASANKMRTSIDATNASLRRQSSLFMQLKSVAAMYFSIFGAARFARNVRETTAELELQRVALGGIVQDTAVADKLFRQIKAAALKSPFEIKDLLTYTKQLSAYRIETDKLFDVTMKLADVSAGLGVDMNRLILAYGQVRAASVLRGQELRQFTEAGIPLVDELAKKFRELGREGTTTADVFDLISKRAVPFSMIESIFEDMTKAGGIFYNMQEKQSETLKGQWMKLRDAVTIMYDEIGHTSVVDKAMRGLISDLLRLTNSWKETARWLGAAISTMITYSLVAKSSAIASGVLAKAEAARMAITKAQTVVMPKFIAKLIGETAAKKVSTIVTRQLTVAQYRLAIATTAAEKAFWRLYAAMIKNPYALAAAAVVALGGAIYALVKNNKEAEVSADSLQKSLSGLENQAKKMSDIERLVEIYEELSKKANKTKEDQATLARVTRELAKAFPEAVSGIDKETDALKINIEKVQELTRAELKLKEIRLEREFGRATDEISELEKERDEILAKVSAGGKYVKHAGGADLFIPLSQKEWDKYYKRIEEINEKLGELKGTAEDAREALFVGPMPDTTTDAKKTAAVWKETLQKIQNEKAAAGAPVIFTPDDIEKMEDVEDLYKKWDKGVKEVTVSLAGLKELQGSLTDEAAKRSNLISITQAEKEIELWEAIADKFGFKGKTQKTGAYQQDPFIVQMQNRMKFMQDFKKGYDDLRKYIGDSSALDKELETMMGRGMSLGLDASQQKRAASDLSKWYEDMIAEVSNKLRAKGVNGPSVTDLLGIDTTKRSKDIQDLQKLLQSLWDAKTDFDTSEMKKNFEEAMTKMKDEIKRSETARNFYNEILGITGDEDIATSLSVSVYGGIGRDFKENMQKELENAFTSVDPDKMTDELRAAFSKLDFQTILSNLDKFPEEWRSRLKEMANDNEKYNADWLRDVLKIYQKTKTYEERISEIRKREAQKRAEIETSTALTDEQKASLTQASIKKEGQEVAEVQVESLKNTYEWTKAFDDLDRVGNQTLKALRRNLEELIEAQKEFLTPEQLKALTDALEKVRDTQENRDPLSAIVSGGRRAALTAAAMRGKPGSDAYASAIEKIKEFNETASETEKIDLNHIEDAFRDANKTMEKGIEGVEEYVNAWKSVVDAVTKAFNLDEIPIVGETLEGISDALSFVASILPVIITLNGILNGTLMMNPFIAAAAGIVATIGAIVGLVKGLINAKIEKLNKKIEEQADLIETLEYQYDRLEKAIEKAFGSDYISNYNQQLETLYAKQEAYLKQASAERSKGKKADEDKIKEYENSAREAADSILDMQSQLSEFFSGTDVTSAAKDFANSWIEAYKEYGSTTLAIRQKFQEMVQEMVEKSLAAKVMQQLLTPIFNEIDRLAQEGGELSADDISSIAKLASDQIPAINDAMLTLMNTLTQAGYNLRQQPGTFTGISRNIANATEESINGLTQQMLVNNLYMSYLPNISANVAQIVAIMSGGTAENPATGAVFQLNNELALQYLSALPSINDKMSDVLAILNRLNGAITDKNTSSNFNVIAVRA